MIWFNAYGNWQFDMISTSVNFNIGRIQSIGIPTKQIRILFNDQFLAKMIINLRKKDISQQDLLSTLSSSN